MIQNSVPSRLPLVRLENVSFSYGSSSVFHDLSFCMERGVHLALMGKNGSGKSSLLRLIQGEVRPTLPLLAGRDGTLGEAAPASSPGKILWSFEGSEESSALAARQHVRLLSSEQQANYVRRGWNITGEEIILSGIANAPMVYGELSSALYAVAGQLAEDAGASHLLSMQAPAMSQGQLRLMLILRALMGRPALLLLDEPFDGLDHGAREAVGHSLELAADRGCTLLVTAHRRGDIPFFIHDAVLLEDGALRPFDLSAVKEPDPMPEPGFAQEPPRPAAYDQMKRFARADSAFLRALANKTRPLFRMRSIDVYIDRHKVLSGINWSVNPGEHWVIAGANGSGKSTLMRLLYGEEFAAWGGSLEWCGRLRPSQEELRSGVGFVSDRLQHRYDYDISVEEVVVSGLRGTIGLYSEPEAEELRIARYWLDMLGILSYAAKSLHSLSGGTARKALLARALAGSPPVLLLDEPCTGLDAPSRHRFLNALSALAEKGVTLIYASHHEEDKASLFDKELRLEKGRVI